VTILIDTSVLIDHLRGHEPARRAFASAVRQGERVVCSVLTRVEVLAGVRDGEERPTRLLLDALEWIAVSDALAEDAGLLANRYLQSHPGVDTVDFVIAATARELEAVLWTRNVKHFPMFPGLTPPY
jgi:predicted nucleic acid-binding protein